MTFFLTENEVLAAHAQFGCLNREAVKQGMGPNWPAHWDGIGPSEGIFAPAGVNAQKLPK